MKISLNLPQHPEDSSDKPEIADPTKSKVEITAHRFLPFHKSIKVEHEGKTYRVKASKIRQAIDSGERKHFHSKDIQKLCRMAKIATGEKHCTTDDIEKVMNIDVNKQNVLLRLSTKKREDKNLSSLLLDAAQDKSINAEELQLLSNFNVNQLSTFKDACGQNVLKPHKSQIINYINNRKKPLTDLEGFIEILNRYKDIEDFKDKIPTLLSYLDKNLLVTEVVDVFVKNIDLLDREAAKIVLQRDGPQVPVQFIMAVFDYIRDGQDVQPKEVDVIMSIANMNFRKEEKKFELVDKFLTKLNSDKNIKDYFDKIDDYNEQILSLYLIAWGADAKLLKFMKTSGGISNKPTNFYVQPQFMVLCGLAASNEYDNQEVLRFAKKVFPEFILHREVLKKIKLEVDNISLGRLKAYLEWSQEDAVKARVSKEQHLAQIQLLKEHKGSDEDIKGILDVYLNDVKQEYALQLIYGEEWESGLSEREKMDKIEQYIAAKSRDKSLETILLAFHKEGKDVQKYYQLALMGFKSYTFNEFGLENYGIVESVEEDPRSRRFYETHFKILTKICDKTVDSELNIPRYSDATIAKLNRNGPLLEKIEEMKILDDPDLDPNKLLFLVNWAVKNRAHQKISDKNLYTQCLRDLSNNDIEPEEYNNSLKRELDNW